VSIGLERGLPLRKFALDAPGSQTRPEKSVGSSDFGTSMGKAVVQIQDSARVADQASDDLVLGKIDLHEAMVKMEKADLMLKLGSTVRTKLVDAYQKLMSAGAG